MLGNPNWLVLTVDTAKFYETSSVVDPCAFLGICGLVVVAQRLGFTLVSQNASRITGIGLNVSRLASSIKCKV